jgi:predicted Zn-dependent protease
VSTHSVSTLMSRRGAIGSALSGAVGALDDHHNAAPPPDDFTVLSRDDLQGIAERALKHSTADGCQVDVVSTVTGNTRFAANQLATAGDANDTTVAITSSFGPKHAVVQINDIADDAIAAAVARSEALAKLAPDDPDAMPPLGAQQYQAVGGYFDSTAGLTPDQRAQAALTALKPARSTTGAASMIAAGYIVATTRSALTANKGGVLAFHRSTTANYTLTVRTADGTGSGWAGADDHDWTKIDTAAVAQHALDKAQHAHAPVAVEPGRYTVIFEPQAVGDLVEVLQFYIDARRADEGRSPFVKASGGNKIGEKIVDSRVTLFSDVADPQLLSQPFDAEGFPLGRQVWIQNGVLTNLSYTRFWAKKQGKPFTGIPNSLKIDGGDGTVDDMIKGTDRGILVTRLWYLREVDPRTALYTGLTRDGTFLIEHGQVTRAVKNFRFNDSPLFLLNNVEAIGPSVRLAGTEAGGDIAVPAIKAHDFNFTSLSDAV